MKKLEFVQGNRKLRGYAPVIVQAILPEAKDGMMLNWPLQEIENQIANGNSILALKDQKFIGYSGLVIWEKYAEIGALIVLEEFRQRGFGTHIVKEISQMARAKYPQKTIIILPNKVSFQLSQKIGFEEKQKDKLDPEIWGTCQYCKEFKNFPDCHCRPMVFAEKIL